MWRAGVRISHDNAILKEVVILLLLLPGVTGIGREGALTSCLASSALPGSISCFVSLGTWCGAFQGLH